MHLKKNHNYFYQIMGQLAIARSKLCFFIVFTHVDFFVEIFLFDSDFFELHMFPQLQLFYKCHYKPFITKQMWYDIDMPVHQKPSPTSLIVKNKSFLLLHFTNWQK